MEIGRFSLTFHKHSGSKCRTQIEQIQRKARVWRIIATLKKSVKPYFYLDTPALIDRIPYFPYTLLQFIPILASLLVF